LGEGVQKNGMKTESIVGKWKNEMKTQGKREYIMEIVK